MRAEGRSTNFINSQLDSLQRNRAVMVGLLLLFVCVVVWMVASIAQSEDSSDLTKEAKKYTTEINPNLDQATLTLVSQKRHYDEADLANIPISILIETKDGQHKVVPISTTPEELEVLISGTSNTLSSGSRTKTTASPSATASRSATPIATPSPTEIENPESTSSANPTPPPTVGE